MSVYREKVLNKHNIHPLKGAGMEGLSSYPIQYCNFYFEISRPLWFSDYVCDSVANELYKNSQRRNFERSFIRTKWKVLNSINKILVLANV